MSDLVLFNLVVPPSVEDALVDWLLGRASVPGFTSLPAFGHGSSVHSMSLAEQVAGRRRQTLFQLYLGREEARALVEDLGAAFSGSGLHYWVLPVQAAGRI